MSGDFLARLGERALGVAASTTPNRAPLFAGLPASPVTELEEMVEARDAGYSNASVVDERAAGDRRPAAPPAPSTPDQPLARPASDARGAEPPVVAPVTPARPAPTAIPATRPSAAPRPAQDLDPRPVAASTKAAAMAARASSQVVAAAAIQSASPVPPAAERRAETTTKPRNQGRRSPAPTAADEPEPSIQVSIGRVEVRLVEEPAAPVRPRPAPHPPAVSLDDYLRARDGRAR